MFFNYFLCFFNAVFLLLLKTKTYKITNMMHVHFLDRASVL